MDTVFIVLLILLSVISLAYIIERGLALRRPKVIPADVEHALTTYDSADDLARLRWTCETNPSPVSRLLILAADHLGWPKTETAGLLETRARHEVSKLERGLVVLEIIVGIAPLMGLVGTIFGLILLFGGMDSLDADKTGQFARGISLALRATLLGLIIAIPTLVAWSYYSRKVETFTVEMESMCDEFLRKSQRLFAATTAAAEEASTQQIASSDLDTLDEEPAAPVAAQPPPPQPRRQGRRR